MLKPSVQVGSVLGGALLVLLLAGPSVTAQEANNAFLRLSRNIPGEVHPITLTADEVTTWADGGQRIVLLKGKVMVTHNLVSMRCQRAVIWFDEARSKQTRILHADVYGEGEVFLESGDDAQKGAKALLDLNTRGGYRLTAYGGKVLQQPHTEDPLFRRAAQEKSPQAPAPPPPPAAAPPVAPPAPAPPVQPSKAPTPGVKQSSFLDTPPAPNGAGGVVPAQAVVPAGAAGAAGGIVPAQALAPADPAPVPAAPLAPVVPGPGQRDAGGQPIPVPASPSLQPPPPGGPAPPQAAVPTPPRPTTARNLTIGVAPRTTAPFQTQSFPLPNGEQAIVVTGGILLTVRSADAKEGLIDMEADELVFWTRNNDGNPFGAMQKSDGHTTRELEFYLAGNVEIRQKNTRDERFLRADEVYYDVGRNVAVAISGDLEMRRPTIPDPIHFRADQLLQLGPHDYEGKHSVIYASRLPSDPGIEVVVQDAKLTTRRKEKRSIFGQRFHDATTGAAEDIDELMFTGYNVFLDIEHIPIFYFPYLHGDARNPLGPLQNVGLGYSNIFGFQTWVTLDVYQLLGLEPFVPNSAWRMDVDYLSLRGPALGTNLDYQGTRLFGWGENKYAGTFKAWGIIDHGEDNLGGGRGPGDMHPTDRGRILWRDNVIDLPYGFTFQHQLSLLSDKNFLEQYYKTEFDMDRNQDTFLYVRQQQGIWQWDLLVEPSLRDWVTETEWLPRVDGYLIGQSFLDRFTYSTHASIGYAQLRPTEQPPFPLTSTDSRIDAGRFDWWHELDAPIQLGAFKVVPYGILDLTEYTDYLNNSPTWPATDTGTARGRFYGAGGIRASVPLTRLYPGAESELFNINGGINHKITLGANYYTAYSDTPFYRLPQLDRINDDATDQALRDITPLQPVFNPAHAVALQTETLFNPQFYAIRHLVDDRPDTLASISELQMYLQQRWQTKRGYPGAEHIVDWMTLDVSAVYFPNPTRDNFGSSVGLIQYDWTWNIGDRTSLVSDGWYDPFDTGGRVTTIGAFFNRPDRTNLYVGYRQIDYLQSRAVTASVSYVFSPKYAITGSTAYDFGTQEAMSNYLALTRMGTDVQVTLGITYNSLQKSFGVVFQIVPNLVPQAGRLGGVPLVGPSPFTR